MSLFNNNLMMGAAGASGGGGGAVFDPTIIPNSVWMDGSSDGFTIASGSMSDQDGKEFTLGTWFQLTEFGVTGALFCAGDTSAYTSFRHGADDKLIFQTKAGTAVLSTSNVFRDVGWYHVLLSVNTTQAVSTNRVRLFINGIENILTGTFPAQDRVYDFNKQEEHEVGNSVENGGFEGYLAQSFMIGSKSIQQGDFDITDFLDSFTFGTNGSQFVPKSSTNILTLVDAGSSNSFLLKYENSGSLGLDSSTNTNNFTATDMGPPNQSTNTSSKTFSMFNPLANGDQSSSDLGSFSLSDGNQTLTLSSSNQWLKTTVPFVMSGSNIIRTEFTIDTVGNGAVGITGSPHSAGTYHTSALGIPGQGEVLLLADGSCVVDGNFGSSGYTSSWSNGDVIDVIVNLNVGAVWFARNGTLGGGATQAEIEAGTTTNAADGGTFVRRTAGEVFNFFAAQTNPSPTTVTYNSGHSAFSNSYSSITSLVPLSTADLAAPDFQGIDYFDATLYEGNGSGQRVGDFVPFTDAFDVAKSAMFQHDEARALSRTVGTPSSSGGKKGTWSTWYKTANIDTDNVFFDTGTTATNRFSLQMDASGQIVFSHSGTTILKTSGDFKGDGAWHNLVLKVDTGQSTASNRAAMFIDGVEQTSFETDNRDNTNLPQDAEIGYMDSGATQFVGSFNGSSANQWDGYLAETIFLDNQFLSADSFGQLDTSTNKWVPKAISGLTLGDQGFYLAYGGDFDTGNGAGDSTGNANNLSVIGTWTSADQFTDTPSKNYPIVSPNTIGSATPTLAKGNLQVTGADNGGNPITMQPTSGKWYFEVELDTANAFYPGLFTAAGLADTNTSPWTKSFAFVYLTTNANGAVYNGGTVVNGYNASGAMSSGDRLAIAWDVDNNFIYFGSASTGSTTFFNSGNPTSGMAGTGAAPFSLPNERLYFGAVHGGTDVSTYHFISSGWEGAAPAGFSELNQDNLDDTASKITAFAWIKNRDATDSHMLFDRVRGVGVELHTNGTTTTPETTNPNTLQRFLQRGVQVGSDVEVNTDNEAYVLWQWLVGDSATTGSSIEAGSISTGVPSLASTALAADAGHFSVVSWTGDETLGSTIGHGLGGTPEFIIAIARAENGENKPVYHKSMTSDNDHLKINEAAAQGTAGTTIWDVSAMSSTLIGLGAAVQSNSNNGMIAYCFRSIPGVCKVGKYFGNGSSTRPPYVALDFEPRFVMIKNLSVARDWIIVDTAISPSNPADLFLFPNLDIAEAARGSASGSDYDIDLLSGAFLPYTGDSAPNGDGNTIIYIAMADLGGNGTLPPIYGR